MVDNKTTDSKPAAKAADTKSAAKKTTAASTKKEAAKKQTAKKEAARKETARKEAATAPVAKRPKAATAATAKAAASKDSDIKSAAKKISEIDRVSANNAVNSRKSAENLKVRAHEAKQRAQKKILEKAYVSDKPADPLERLANTFDSSARRWEMVVYPSLFAFVLLAGYGFFLIYRLTHDIAILSQSVTHMAVIVSDSMPRMTKDLGMMTGSIDNMTGNINDMTTEVSSMSNQMDALTPMSNNIQSMTHNIGSMNRSVYGMQRDMHGMNRTVSSGPFGMMNDMMPFSSSSNVPPPMAQSPTWPSYGNQKQGNAYARPHQPARVLPVKQVKVVPQQQIKTEVTMPGASPVSVKQVPSPESSLKLSGAR
jgi:chemotaxis protein histidine kinase CheA